MKRQYSKRKMCSRSPYSAPERTQTHVAPQQLFRLRTDRPDRQEQEPRGDREVRAASTINACAARVIAESPCGGSQRWQSYGLPPPTFWAIRSRPCEAARAVVGSSRDLRRRRTPGPPPATKIQPGRIGPIRLEAGAGAAIGRHGPAGRTRTSRSRPSQPSRHRIPSARRCGGYSLGAQRDWRERSEVVAGGSVRLAGLAVGEACINTAPGVDVLTTTGMRPRWSFVTLRRRIELIHPTSHHAAQESRLRRWTCFTHPRSGSLVEEGGARREAAAPADEAAPHR